jgi:hypothetical protein
MVPYAPHATIFLITMFGMQLTPRVNGFGAAAEFGGQPICRPVTPGLLEQMPAPGGPQQQQGSSAVPLNDRDRLLLRLDHFGLVEREVLGDGACQVGWSFICVSPLRVGGYRLLVKDCIDCHRGVSSCCLTLLLRKCSSCSPWSPVFVSRTVAYLRARKHFPARLCALKLRFQSGQ